MIVADSVQGLWVVGTVLAPLMRNYTSIMLIQIKRNVYRLTKAEMSIGK